MTIKIQLHEGDFAAVMTPAERREVFGTERVLAEGNTAQSPTSILEELLPSALVAKVRRLTPPDFELSEITIDAEVSGKVLGTGVSGNFSMKLVRSETRRTPADAGELERDVSAGAPAP
jgi:hypothetical protein